MRSHSHGLLFYVIQFHSDIRAVKHLAVDRLAVKRLEVKHLTMFFFHDYYYLIHGYEHHLQSATLGFDLLFFLQSFGSDSQGRMVIDTDGNIDTDNDLICGFYTSESLDDTKRRVTLTWKFIEIPAKSYVGICVANKSDK